MTYVALLRGVNVGAHNRVKMGDLKAALEGIGLARVETYIQSGNVAFDSELDEAALLTAIRAAIFARFGLSINAVLRSAPELRALVENLPFSAAEVARAVAENAEGESLYVFLLSRPPEESKLARTAALTAEGERFAAVGRDAYLLLSHSVRNSKLAVAAQKLDAAATARNWNTIQRLAAMAGERGG